MTKNKKIDKQTALVSIQYIDIISYKFKREYSEPHSFEIHCQLESIAALQKILDKKVNGEYEIKFKYNGSDRYDNFIFDINFENWDDASKFDKSYNWLGEDNNDKYFIYGKDHVDAISDYKFK